MGLALSKLNLVVTLLVATLIAIFKLIWMIYEAQRVTHFQFWILTSLEVRINQISKKIKVIEKEMKNINKSE